MSTNLRAALRALGEPPSSIDFLLSRNPTPSSAAVISADALPVAGDGVDFHSSDDEGPASPMPVAQHTGD